MTSQPTRPKPETRSTQVTLVTGATAGIGAEFAAQLAARGFELVLVARGAERLDAASERLSAEFGIRVDTIAVDLATDDGVAAVEARITDFARPVDFLVNNAGYGLAKHFDENSIEQELHHLALHVTVPLRLAHAALGQMLPRRTGTIVNIASVAGFTPRDTYGAAKAWVLSFSRWANGYYRGRGITVTAVAPGFVRTEFHSSMKVSTAGIPRVLWLDAPRLVRIALRDVDRGKAVSIPTLRYKALVAAIRILPDRLSASGSLRSQ